MNMLSRMFKPPTLQSLSKTCGWAAKISPVGLRAMLAELPRVEDPNLLMGFDTSDDAGIYRINDETAIIMTADFITPPVEDPYVFGQIAAANAISDVYAMGGRPVACLNLVAFPSGKLPQEMLHRIVAGGLERITEAGAVLAGGHSIDDDEPKYGLSVTGVVHPERYWSNAGARPGDVLILTKAIGSGVLFNANLKGWVPAADLAACTDTLIELNKTAAAVLSGREVHAATDVTGFGIAGHGYEMADASDVTMVIDTDRLPVMASALEMYERGMTTGVNLHNRQMIAHSARFETHLPPWHCEIVFDPQTSGGLLAAVPEADARDALAALQEAGVARAAVIGRVEPAGDHRIIFR